MQKTCQKQEQKLSTSFKSTNSVRLSLKLTFVDSVFSRLLSLFAARWALLNLEINSKWATLCRSPLVFDFIRYSHKHNEPEDISWMQPQIFSLLLFSILLLLFASAKYTTQVHASIRSEAYSSLVLYSAATAFVHSTSRTHYQHDGEVKWRRCVSERLG